MCPLLGTWPTTQACALTGNPTSDPLVCRPELSPLSHTSQGTVDIIITLVSGVQHSDQTFHNLLSDHPNKSYIYLTPYIVIRLLLFSLYYALHLHDYCVTTSLYFLIPSLLHILPTLLLSVNPQNVLCIYDFVSVLLVTLFSFLDSIFGRYIFIAIVLIFLISFLKKILLTFHIILVVIIGGDELLQLFLVCVAPCLSFDSKRQLCRVELSWLQVCTLIFQHNPKCRTQQQHAVPQGTHCIMVKIVLMQCTWCILFDPAVVLSRR